MTSVYGLAYSRRGFVLVSSEGVLIARAAPSGTAVERVIVRISTRPAGLLFRTASARSSSGSFFAGVLTTLAAAVDVRARGVL